jgi:hypothetical protein
VDGTPATARRKRATPAARGGGSTGRGRGKKEPVPTLPEIAAAFRLLQPDGGKHLRKSSIVQVCGSVIIQTAIWEELATMISHRVHGL